MQDKIEFYLENKLSSKDRAKFEYEILMNPLLAEKIEKRKELLAIMSNHLTYDSMFSSKEDKAILTRKQEIAIEEDILEYHKEYENNEDQKDEKLKKIIREVINSKNHRTRNPYHIFKIAASLIIFVLISGGIFNVYKSGMEKKKTTAIIASQFFHPELDEYLIGIKHSIDIQRNAPEDPLGNISDNNKEKSVNQNLLLVDAVSDMENQDLKNARAKLEKIYNSNDSHLQTAALWYYAILQAKEGKRKEASKILNKIVIEKNYYYSGANSLLILLNNE